MYVVTSESFWRTANPDEIESGLPTFSKLNFCRSVFLWKEISVLKIIYILHITFISKWYWSKYITAQATNINFHICKEITNWFLFHNTFSDSHWDPENLAFPLRLGSFWSWRGPRLSRLWCPCISFGTYHPRKSIAVSPSQSILLYTPLCNIPSEPVKFLKKSK
jgi:hypothetical protein